MGYRGGGVMEAERSGLDVVAEPPADTQSWRTVRGFAVCRVLLAWLQCWLRSMGREKWE